MSCAGWNNDHIEQFGNYKGFEQPFLLQHFGNYKQVFLSQDNDGNIPFHTACKEGKENLVRVLLNNEEDILRPNRLGVCGIHLAISEGHKG